MNDTQPNNEIEALKKERDEARAICAEKDAVLRLAYNAWSVRQIWKIESDVLHHALLSFDCGKGWLSPEKRMMLVGALEYFLAAVHADIKRGCATKAQWGVGITLAEQALALVKE